MRLLVTGGAGYIGSVVTAQLLAGGHQVTVLDDLSTGHADAVPDGARFVHASLLDVPVLAAVLADGFDGVLHFAAKSLVGESVAHPEHYWRNNVVGTFELLEYPTLDGTAIRDYIHVEDLGWAHLLALDASKPGRHAIYNLGNGLGSSVREVIEAARRVTGRPIATVDAPRRPGDPAVLVASSARIGQKLGWTPHKPALDDMVVDAWACLQGHGPERV
jgi:UDP-glucose 4-epimerase